MHRFLRRAAQCRRSDESLPEAISSVPNMTRRELVIVQDKDKARVSSSGKLTGPIVYEFRLAHS